MLINEVVSAEAKLDLWRLISNSVWNTLDAQARAELAAKAEKAAARKPRGAGARTAKPRPPVGPVKPAVAAAKPQAEPTGKPPPEQRTQPQPVVPQANVTTTPVDADASAAKSPKPTIPKPNIPKPNLPMGGALLARARGVTDGEALAPL